MRILVTGGAGYIGTHVCVELLAAGHDVVVLDNFSNSKPAALERVERIAGRKPALVTGDIRDRTLVRQTLEMHRTDAVMHLAGVKAVGESVAKPLDYYDINVAGSVSLLLAMRDANVRTIVFSSSATVYGDPASLPIREDFPCAPTNPYGHTKRMIELILQDEARADSTFAVSILRYFNPVGAHPSGLIGEDPRDIPNNLLPFVSQVAAGRREKLAVFGNDWPTPDGTGVRDYLHVVDLAKGHLAAINRASAGAHVYNLGTGNGNSVLDIVRAMERACGRAIPYVMSPRRPGDIAACWADPTQAQAALGWRAEISIDDACTDAWRWQQGNPDGYPE
jgi:UDP-glucose 4-epimerase